MKNLFLSIYCLILVLSCDSQTNNSTEALAQKIPAVSKDMMESAVIYEANIRQYSPKGTFEEFTKDIPVLKELGVKILWVMPIHPVSKLKRKAKGDLFTSQIEDEAERKKYLGSYYSVSDFKAINPEFGNLYDFKDLVLTAHNNGIYVILDWGPNHTGWDHPWITKHPDWYTQDEQGNIVDPLDPSTGKSWGWTDVADLNYDNMDMRKEMIADMKYWVDEIDIDGFRVDVAHQVPVPFFKTAIEELEKVKPLFMLAEAEKKELFSAGFDMHYGWEGHHLLNSIAKGEKNAQDFRQYIMKQDTMLGDQDFSMNFVTNHDENSWAGTLRERMPESKELFTVLTYLMPGMPLIYSGQEYDLDHRLKFFEKDSIPKQKGDYFGLLKKLGELKNTSTSLHGGKDAADMNVINSGDGIIAFSRSKGDKKVTFIANVTEVEVGYAGITGEYIDYISGNKLTIDNKEGLRLDPWEYVLLVAEK